MIRISKSWLLLFMLWQVAMLLSYGGIISHIILLSFSPLSSFFILLSLFFYKPLCFNPLIVLVWGRNKKEQKRDLKECLCTSVQIGHFADFCGLSEIPLPDRVGWGRYGALGRKRLTKIVVPAGTYWKFNRNNYICCLLNN